MKINSFKFKLLKSIVLFAICLMVSFGLQRFSSHAAENFFLDWKQILLNGEPPSNPFTILSISALKTTSKDLPKLSEAQLMSVLTTVSSGEPRIIILAISPDEIESADLEMFAKKLGEYPKLLLFESASEGRGSSTFAQNRYFSNLPNLFSVILTYDSRYDKVTRRIMISYDEDKAKLSEDFSNLPKILGIKLMNPMDMKDDFSYMDSRQVFMKIWNGNKLNLVQVKQFSDLENRAKSLKDRIVVIATQDTFSLAGSPSINYRKDFSVSSIKNSYWTDAELLVTYIINLMTGDYVRTPSVAWNTIWLAMWIFVVSYSLFFFPLRLGIPMSFLWAVLFPVFGAVLFKLTSYDLDFSRGLLVSFLIQYLGIPVLLIRYLRKTDRDKIEIEKQQERDRVKSRFVVKAAKADLTLQVAARVSHDIRSPLMALQIASSVMKGKVPEDLETLVKDSTARIKYIADDILDNYREGKSKGTSERSSLEALVVDLLKSYRQIYPEVSFQVRVAGDLYIFIPQYSLQRCLTNLINNAIEAMAGQQRSEIVIEAQSTESGLVISIKDNGPGITIENQARLFQERATFGKVGGTGLGLYQVRKELALYGARIAYVHHADGGQFDISIPVSLDQIEFQVAARVVVLESGSSIFSALSESKEKGIELVSCDNIQLAMHAIANADGQGRKWTVFTDLVLSSDEETGFDLIEKTQNYQGQVILCTTLADHKDIQEVANRFGALLVSREMLSRLKLIL